MRNTLASMAVGIAAADTVVVLVLMYIEYRGSVARHEYLVQMTGVQACMDTPGCFYDADDLVDTKRALDYSNQNCSK